MCMAAHWSDTTYLTFPCAKKIKPHVSRSPNSHMVLFKALLQAWTVKTSSWGAFMRLSPKCINMGRVCANEEGWLRRRRSDCVLHQCSKHRMQWRDMRQRNYGKQGIIERNAYRTTTMKGLTPRQLSQLWLIYSNHTKVTVLPLKLTGSKKNQTIQLPTVKKIK